ncbi:MAG: VRR-NUC domain-containing protein [Clostridiaceae bacterium]|nr:VRR-NUC domain-containing protein [Clostridiaceae bacterium]
MKLEKEDERYLKTRVEERGGLCYKFVSPGNKGVPDRIVITPSGRVYFVEIKSSSGAPSKMQLWQIAELKRRNCDVRILQGRDQIKSFLEEVFQD